MMLIELPLYILSEKTKFITFNEPTYFGDVESYTPRAFPTGFELGSGRSVKGSSITITAPKAVEEVFVNCSSATLMAVGVLPLMLSW